MIFKNFYFQIKSKIIAFYETFPIEKLEISVNRDLKTTQLGDISINAAMILAKIKKENPLKIAEEMKKFFFEESIMLKIEIAGSGFLNFFFLDSFFQKYLFDLKEKKALYIEKINSSDNYNIEFVSANPTGPLHIGHGRNAIIGDVLAKCLQIKGLRVAKEFYINDAGSQITKLGLSIFVEYKNKCGIKTDPLIDGYQGSYIAEIAELLFEKYNNTCLTYDISFFSFFGKEILLKNIETTLLDYQVSFDVWFSEKQLHENHMIEKAIEILDEKGFIYRTDDQVIWFKATFFGDEKDRVLKKNNGDWTYTASDIAYFLNKIERGYNKIVMILGQDHHSFKIRLEAIAKALSFDTKNFHIILYQLVALKNEGELTRMSKRKGNSIDLKNLIESLGSDVARFFYLNKKADAHLDFNIKDALEKNTNNPVFYIQYAMVRIKSIFEKAKKYQNKENINNENVKYVFNDVEKLLLKQIGSLDEVLEKIVLHLAPHLITYFTIELTSLFHHWYNFEQFIDEKNEDETKKRLFLLSAVYEVLDICVSLLGIYIPDKM